MATKDLDLTSLRLFVAVCDARNIAHAADREHLVGSAVSKRMAQLELQMGTPLLVRKRHGVAPTPAGETLLEYARAMLASAHRVEQAMAAYASGVRGQVRLLATASVMAEALADDVVAFMQQPAHADIRVDIEERFSPDVIRGVRDGVASVGICWDATDFQGLTSLPYLRDHLGMVVHARHPLARRKHVAFAETLDWEHVSLPATSAVQALLERAAAQHGQRLRTRVMVSNFEAALRVAHAGLAICVVPRELLHGAAGASQLHFIALTDAWAERHFSLCYRDHNALSPAARLLVDHLAARHLPRSA